MKNKNLILEVKNIKIIPATLESGAPELTADIILRNKTKKTLLINFYNKPQIKNIKPKSLFHIRKAIHPPVRMKEVNPSDILRILPNKKHIYKYHIWLENIYVANSSYDGWTYNLLKSGECTITFYFKSSINKKQKKSIKENEILWEGEVLSLPVKLKLTLGL